MAVSDSHARGTAPRTGVFAVWRRNARVWRKLVIPSLIGHFGEPLLFLLLFGYGLGQLVGEVDGMPYMVFIASGLACSTAMFAAKFEALYSAFTRLKQQRTWEAMLNTPLSVRDIAGGEILWAATKGLINSSALMIVALAFGLIHAPGILPGLAVIALGALAFAAMAMIITALAPNYDFFLYYFTLVMTPMMLLSGVFFPMEVLPGLIQGVAWALPLAHLVALVRPLLTEVAPGPVLLHLGVVIGWSAVCFPVAVSLLRRRLAD